MADGDALTLGQYNVAQHGTDLSRDQGDGAVLYLFADHIGLEADATGIGAADDSLGIYAVGYRAGVYALGGSGTEGFDEEGAAVSAEGVGSAPGVKAFSVRGPGVYANSVRSFAVEARGERIGGVYAEGPDDPGQMGVWGYGNGLGTGVVGTSNSGYSGLFYGKFAVRGDFTVYFGSKSAAVPHPDGSHRRLYSLESPESWFEDFGSAVLRDGKARVDIDPDFAAIVRNDPYHIFLTPEGDSKGLYVSSKGATAFEVREQQGGTSNLTFSYRIVGRRKDIPGERLEKVDLPPSPPPPPPPRRSVTRPNVSRPREGSLQEGKEST